MNVDVDLADDTNVRLSDAEVTARPPDSIAFEVRGSLSVGSALLGQFVNRTLKPSWVTFSVDDGTESVDLSGDASLRLESIDVGVETADADDVVSNPTDVASDAVTDAMGSVSFTVTGVIENVAEGTTESLSTGTPEPASITFSVDESLATDGGRRDLVAEFGLLGYGIVVRRDGTVSIRAPGA